MPNSLDALTSGLSVRWALPREAARIARASGEGMDAARVLVAGRVEKILCSATLTFQEPALLRVDEAALAGFPAYASEVLEPIFYLAASKGLHELRLQNSVEEGSPGYEMLIGWGFEPLDLIEVYSIDRVEYSARIERTYQRMLRRGGIPAGAKVVPAIGGWARQLEKFLAEHAPHILRQVKIGGEGFDLAQSAVLLIEGEAKGVLFSEQRDKRVLGGYVVIAPEWRGGLPWPYLMLFREGQRSKARSAADKESFFLVNARSSPNARQFANSYGACLVARRWTLSRKLDGMTA
jgi:hypothetical protein